MDDDDNDDAQNDQKEDDEDDISFNTYSKKKYFGKITKDLKSTYKINYRPRAQALKALKISVDGGKKNMGDRFKLISNMNIEHKISNDDYKYTTKITSNFRDYYIDKISLNSKIKTKLFGNTLQFSNNITNKSQFTSKATHSYSWQYFKLRYGLDVEKKNQVYNFGGKINIDYKNTFKNIPYFSFTQYNYLFSLGTNYKTNKRQIFDFVHRSHLVTKDNHKAFFEYKCTYDPNTRNTQLLNHLCSFNIQDAEAVRTLNTAINIQNNKIKSKQIRFVLQYDKKMKFGVEKKNKDFEFMFQWSKIKRGYLNAAKFYIGNKGFLAVFQGKLNWFKTKTNFNLSARLKPGGGNFYNDFSAGAYLSWNI